jgi:hypothetical protein
MERDIVKLVALNRRRGYDIVIDHWHGNMFFSDITEMIKLNFICGDLIADGTSFEGYKATETIIETILRFLYSRRDLFPDIDHSLVES